MKPIAIRAGIKIVWLMLAILGAVLYGILNDQITVTLSPEYFSVFKRQMFADALEQAGLLTSPTRIQAVWVGTLATWWFGLILGMILTVIGMAGRRPRLLTRHFVRAVSDIMLFTLCTSILFGIAGYVAEPFVKPTVDQWPFLKGIHEVRRAFAIGFWHDGAYLGGLVGTLLAGVSAHRQRVQLARPAPPSPP